MITGQLKKLLLNYGSIIFFAFLTIIIVIVSREPLAHIFSELATRIGRNTFMIIALLIPIQAGLGLNFAITIGAMAAQLAMFIVVILGITGVPGILLCAAIAAPLAAVLGYLVGRLFNNMKGSEMIGGIMLAFFATGIYQLVFLYIIGGVIKIDNPEVIISSGVGVKNTIDLSGKLKYAIDGTPEFLPQWLASIVKPNFVGFLNMVVPIIIIVSIVLLFLKYKNDLKGKKAKRVYVVMASAIFLYVIGYIPAIKVIYMAVHIPIITYSLIALVCLFTHTFMRTRIGQKMRTVGQNRAVARSAGIDVNKTRILAMVISTVLASIGQLILLQNIGTFQTYNAHDFVGQYAIAALLVGGASVKKAKVSQALIGVCLFHTLFIVSPNAGKAIMNSSTLGEFFRVAVAYGVIAISLAIYAYQEVRRKH